MSDGPVVEAPKGTAYYGRKVNLGDYNSEECGIHVQFEVNLEDVDVTVANANEAVFAAKLAVFAQLGLEATYEDGVLSVARTFAPSPTVTAPPPSNQGGSGTARSSAPAASSGGAVVCPECEGPMFDNRQKNDEKVAAGGKRPPDFRCKNYKPENGSCEGIIWKLK